MGGGGRGLACGSLHTASRADALKPLAGDSDAGDGNATSDRLVSAVLAGVFEELFGGR
jgi:hypothetical protein